MRDGIDMGRVISGTFEIYAKQIGLLLPAALILFLPAAVLSGLVRESGTSILLSLVAVAVGLIAAYWFQGMTVEAVRDIQDGRRDYSVGQLFRSAMPVIGPLLVVGILAGLGIGLGLLLVIIPGLILLTIWSVVAPVVVVERTGAVAAFGRSRELVRGNGFPVFGVIVFFFIINAIISAILTAILTGVSDTFGGYAVASWLTNALVAPLQAIAVATLYFELRRAHGEPEVDAGVRTPTGTAATATTTAPPPATDRPDIGI